jgi:hypothetical protein
VGNVVSQHVKAGNGDAGSIVAMIAGSGTCKSGARLAARSSLAGISLSSIGSRARGDVVYILGSSEVCLVYIIISGVTPTGRSLYIHWDIK